MANIKSLLFAVAAGTAALVSSCTGGASQSEGNLTLSGLDPAKFDTTLADKPVKLYTLKNSAGMEVCITNFGGRTVSIMVPDREGRMQDVVLGFDNVAQYADSVNSPSDFGAAIGRYANRINKGKITIDGKEIRLPTNNYGHCLHGGPDGWQYRVYDAKQDNDSTLVLSITSPDGDACFPGEVKASVTYTLLANNALDIKYEATTSATTIINMTDHSYFNLNGDAKTTIENCEVTINADSFTPTDTTFMTTGEILPVENTPMDFRKAKAIGKEIDTEFLQTKWAMGYDHNWCLNTYKDGKGDDTQVAATMYSPTTGIMLEVLTNEPGIQFYTGNFQDGTSVGKKGIAYQKRAGACFETQKYPDTPNKPEWPSALLKPGEKYYSHCIFRFSVR